jgi:RNA polymerase sigma-70 factor, ECF subfamily
VDLSSPGAPRGRPRRASGEEPRGRDPQGAELVELMAKSALGDHGAFAELYDLTVRRIHGVVLRVLRSPEHAEEVTQEVYVEVWQQSARYTPAKGSVLAWIATMAHRRAVDRVRSVSSEVTRDHKYAYESVDPEVDRVWDRVAQNHDVDRVRAAMQALTPIQREALTLAYFDGLTQSQIAEQLDLPLGTVKTRIRDALKKLAETLGAGEP